MAGFQDRLDKIEAQDARVIAGSVDPVDETRQMVEDLRLRFPVMCELDAEETGELIGGYVNQAKQHLQPAAFLLRPDGTVELAVYSSGRFGRLTAKDVLDHLKENQED